MDRYALRYRDLISRGNAAVILAIGLGNVLTLLGLVLLIRETMRAIGEFTTGEVELASLLTLLVIFALLQSVIKAYEFILPERISYRIVHRLRQVLHNHMAGMAPRQIQHRSRGSLILRLSGDLTMLRTWISRGLGRGAIALLSSLGCVALLGWISPEIAATVVLCFGIGAVISVLLGKRLQKYTGRVRKRRSLLTSNIDEQVNALAVIQVFGRSKGEAARLARQSAWMTRALVQEAEMRGVMRSVSSASGWIALILALWIGAWDVVEGRIALDSVLIAVIVTRQLQGYVRTLGLAHDYWRRAEISRRKLEDFMNSSSRQLADPGKGLFLQNRAAISLQDLSVEGALDSITATAQAGQHIAIIGPSGAGKSTLLQTVAQLVTPAAGTVRIGSQDLADCQIESIIRKVGMVSPDLPLMRGTIRRNLTYRLPRASEAQLRVLIEHCNLQSLIDSFPEGLDFWVTEGGANLSVGARQCIALGRALLGSPPILLLDEAISPLDPEYREHFRNLISRYAGTILAVTHDPREIALADMVWTLDNGQLASVETAAQHHAGHPGEPRPVHQLKVVN